MTNEEASSFVMAEAHRLGEHFDAVQILVTRMNGGSTQYIARGVGNWYARQGIARAFVQNDVHEDLAREIADQLKPDGGS